MALMGNSKPFHPQRGSTRAFGKKIDCNASPGGGDKDSGGSPMRDAYLDLAFKPAQTRRSTRGSGTPTKPHRTNMLRVSTNSLGLLVNDRGPNLTEDQITEMLLEDDSRPLSHLPPYMLEGFQKLRANEEKEQLPSGFMRIVQKDLTSHMRLILVDWVVEVCEAYKLSSQTLQLSIGLIDRYLSRKPIERTKLQLLGITAMMLSSKITEIYPPTVGDFVYISDNTYSNQSIRLMEAEMFKTLEYKATLITANDMLGPLGVVLGADAKTIRLACFTIELSMLETFAEFALPSQIALSALFLARRTLGHVGWSKELTQFSQYSLFNVMLLIREMHTMLMQPRPRKKFNAVIEKYSTSKQGKVALITCPAWAEIIAGSPIVSNLENINSSYS